MSLVLQSSSGGSVTINEPATASNFTQTLPAATGSVVLTDVAGTLALAATGANIITASTNGSERVRINSSGYVTTVFQPSFMVGFSSSGSVSLADNTLIPFDNKTTGACYDVSGSFNTSTNRFTAPVTGVYLFQVNIASSTAGGFSVQLKKNGSTITNGADTIAGFTQNTGVSAITMITTIQVQLNANDYIEAFTRNGAYSVFKNHSWMLGRLLG